MTEKELNKLGFKKELQKGLDDTMFYYYIIDIGDIVLISNSNDEAKKDGWKVEFFDSQSITFTDSKDIKDVVKALKRNLKQR